MTDRELFEQALEALKLAYAGIDALTVHGKAITALEQRLAQPEQEPVIDKLECVPPSDTLPERVDEEAKQRQDQKPPVKTYCGGVPNYCTPEQEPVIQWDASAPLVMQLHPAFQQPEPRITFYPSDPMKEVMRIDRHGVKVNPEFTVDEATQHVLNALTAHIQHTINHAVAAEREACAQLLDEMAARDKLSNYYAVAAKAIRARGQE